MPMTQRGIKFSLPQTKGESAHHLARFAASIFVLNNADERILFNNKCVKITNILPKNRILSAAGGVAVWRNLQTLKASDR